MDQTIFKAVIRYYVDQDHPDIKCIKHPEQEQSFDDTYKFDYFYWGDNTDGMLDYMKQDLALIAGGGYNTDHIHQVSYSFVRIN